MNRTTTLRRRTPLQRGSSRLTRVRLALVSKKVERDRSWFDAVYTEVDARTINAPEGVCESCLTRRFSDRHHTKKPRRSYHEARYILRVCRSCHQECDAPYAQGRRIITPLGGGQFTSEVVYARDKFALRESA